MFSKETEKRFREIEARLTEIMGWKKCTREEAWCYLTANGAYKAVDVAAKMAKRQDQIAQAERRAKAAYNSTFSSNIQYDDGDVT
jgi:hypothetical protein